MGKKNIFWFFAWLILAAISCIATANSIALTIEMKPFWLMLLVWFIVAFILYALTSKFLGDLVDSLNPNVRMKRPLLVFWRSLILVIILWGVLSMPTNTHSLLYQKQAEKVLTSELEVQKDVFVQEYEKPNNIIKKKFIEDSTKIANGMNSMIGAFINEATRPDRSGIGDRCDTILNSAEALCEKPIRRYIKRDLGKNKSSVDYYVRQMGSMRDDAIGKKRLALQKELLNYPNRQKILKSLINTCDKTLSKYKHDSIGNEQVKEVIKENYQKDSISTARIYNRIEVLKRGEIIHESKNVDHYNQYRTERLYNVFDVWTDYISGKLGALNFGMFYWVLISIVIDLAAFLSFLKYENKI